VRRQRVPIVRVALKGDRPDNDAAGSRADNARLTPELKLFGLLPFGDATYRRFMEAANLIVVALLLLKDAVQGVEQYRMLFLLPGV